MTMSMLFTVELCINNHYTSILEKSFVSLEVIVFFRFRCLFPWFSMDFSLIQHQVFPNRLNHFSSSSNALQILFPPTLVLSRHRGMAFTALPCWIDLCVGGRGSRRIIDWGVISICLYFKPRTWIQNLYKKGFHLNIETSGRSGSGQALAKTMG